MVEENEVAVMGRLRTTHCELCLPARLPAQVQGRGDIVGTRVGGEEVLAFLMEP